MGYLTQASSGIANSSQVTLSFWAKVLAPTSISGAVYSPLMVWGIDAGVVGSSIIYWVNYDDGRKGIKFYLTGPTGTASYSEIDLGDGFWTNPDGFAEGVSQAQALDGALTSSVDGLAVFSAGGAVGSWFHCLFSINTAIVSHVTDGVVSTAPLYRMILNGVDCTATVLDVRGAAPAAVSNETTGISSTSGYAEIPAGTVGFASRTLGIPSFPSSSDFSVEGDSTPFPVNNTNMAKFMMWTGVFINDPLAAYSNFVIVADGHGTPAPEATAVAAYGTPKIWLSGGSTRFLSNQGSGGGFSKVGTINDTTGVSY